MVRTFYLCCWTLSSSETEAVPLHGWTLFHLLVGARWAQLQGHVLWHPGVWMCPAVLQEGNKKFNSYQDIQADLYLVLISSKFSLIFGSPLASLLSSPRRLICHFLIIDLYVWSVFFKNISGTVMECWVLISDSFKQMSLCLDTCECATWILSQLISMNYTFLNASSIYQA